MLSGCLRIAHKRTGDICADCTKAGIIVRREDCFTGNGKAGGAAFRQSEHIRADFSVQTAIFVILLTI